MESYLLPEVVVCTNITPHGVIIVHKSLAYSLSCMWQYTVFSSSGIAHIKPSNFNIISLILGIGMACILISCWFSEVSKDS